ncbi:hypothetical protein LCGC14_1846100 [marine sediment metagenome]|uniref:Uncharacterized protein n=1 Tax=marine sediment metagenome TaxID=412755 RepID=A0A0F9IRF7_9ZZZZ
MPVTGKTIGPNLLKRQMRVLRWGEARIGTDRQHRKLTPEILALGGRWGKLDEQLNWDGTATVSIWDKSTRGAPVPPATIGERIWADTEENVPATEEEEKVYPAPWLEINGPEESGGVLPAGEGCFIEGAWVRIELNMDDGLWYAVNTYHPMEAVCLLDGELTADTCRASIDTVSALHSWGSGFKTQPTEALNRFGWDADDNAVAHIVWDQHGADVNNEPPVDDVRLGEWVLYQILCPGDSSPCTLHEIF